MKWGENSDEIKRSDEKRRKSMVVEGKGGKGVQCGPNWDLKYSGSRGIF
jgi:hypothetical protein